MILKPTNDILDPVIRAHIEFLQAQCQPVALDGTLVEDTKTIEDNEWVIVKEFDKIYFRQGNKIYEVAITGMTTL